MAILRMAELALRGKRVLIRQDLNVPITKEKITSSIRIDAAMGTIRLAIEAGAKVMLMSHRGRPKEGEQDPQMSLAPVAEYLSCALGQRIKLNTNYLQHPPQLANGEVLLLENVRFNVGEKSNHPDLAKRYAALCDVFVMDAFGAAHRKQASTVGIACYAPQACAGPALLQEIKVLHDAMKTPKRPLVAIVGGAKVATKLAALNTLSEWVDLLILGGGIANTFIAAAGYNIGKSMYEPNLVGDARKLMEATAARGWNIPLPTDVVVTKRLSESPEATIKTLDQIDDDDMIFDIGPETAQSYSQLIEPAGMILWNGPPGLFEVPEFAHGTEILGNAIVRSNAISISGGGDTLAAAKQFNLIEKLSYVSTGGGALLKFIAGETLPAVAILETCGVAGYTIEN